MRLGYERVHQGLGYHIIDLGITVGLEGRTVLPEELSCCQMQLFSLTRSQSLSTAFELRRFRNPMKSRLADKNSGRSRDTVL